MSVCPSWQIQALIWRLYDMDMMWRCLCSEKNKMLEETSLARSLLGPRSGINQYGRKGFSGRRFKEKSIIRGVFFCSNFFTTVSKAQEDFNHYTRLTSPKSWSGWYYRPCYDFFGFVAKKQILYYLSSTLLSCSCEESNHTHQSPFMLFPKNISATISTLGNKWFHTMISRHLTWRTSCTNICDIFYAVNISIFFHFHFLRGKLCVHSSKTICQVEF